MGPAQRESFERLQRTPWWHFDDPGKARLLAAIARFLRPGVGVELGSCPRDTVRVRALYRAFRDEVEVSYGYRELMALAEHRDALERGGFRRLEACTLPGHDIAVARPKVASCEPPSATAAARTV